MRSCLVRVLPPRLDFILRILQTHEPVLVQAGRKPSELAKEFNCHATSILSWVRQIGGSVPVAVPANVQLTSTRRAGALPASRQTALPRLPSGLHLVGQDSTFTRADASRTVAHHPE